MPNKTLNAWGAVFVRSLLLRLGIAAIVIPLGIVCVFVPLYLSENGNFDDTTNFLILAIPISAFFFLLVGGTLGMVAWILLRRKRQLDEAFIPLGLTGSMYLLNGRQFHGSASGRQVDVYYYRGSTLDLYLSTPLKTRLGISMKDSIGQAVAGLINRRPINLNDPELSRLNIFPVDETWARALVADPVAKAAILRLTADQGPYELRQVLLQPEAFLLRCAHIAQKQITSENAQQWLADLITLARAAEGLPAPEKIIEASALEKSTRVDRNKIILPVVGITCGVVALISLCAIIPAIVLSLSEGR
jgi:hypothetical protein